MIYIEVKFDLGELLKEEDLDNLVRETVIETIKDEVRTDVRLKVKNDKELKKAIDTIRNDVYLKITKVIEQ